MATFDEQRKKAFDFCADVTKQLITISAGIIAFTVTFAKDFVSNVSDCAKIFAYVAWGLHFISILLGFIVLLALTAELEPKTAPQSDVADPIPTIRGAAATYSFLQIAFFSAAIFFTITFGFQAVRSPVSQDKNNANANTNTKVNAPISNNPQQDR